MSLGSIWFYGRERMKGEHGRTSNVSREYTFSLSKPTDPSLHTVFPSFFFHRLSFTFMETAIRIEGAHRSSKFQDGLALYSRLEPCLYPSLNPALVLGHDISHHCPSLMYGELSGETLVKALGLIDELEALPREGEGSLIDIGSGIGKQIFTAACVYAWKRCIGVEIYEKRAKLAEEALQRWKSKESSIPMLRTRVVDFACSDIVEIEMERFQVILLVSAAFTDTLMRSIAKVLDSQAVGTLAICITKPLPGPKWEVVHKSEREEPWGQAWLIIQKKTLA